MKYTVDMNDRPVYLQIYRLLRADIVGGAFAYGSRLPSKRLLAEELGVSTVTTAGAGKAPRAQQARFSRITAQQDYAKGYRGQGGRDTRTLAAQGAHGAARCTAAIFSEKPRNKR